MLLKAYISYDIAHSTNHLFYLGFISQKTSSTDKVHNCEVLTQYHYLLVLFSLLTTSLTFGYNLQAQKLLWNQECIYKHIHLGLV